MWVAPNVYIEHLNQQPEGQSHVRPLCVSLYALGSMLMGAVHTKRLLLLDLLHWRGKLQHSEVALCGEGLVACSQCAYIKHHMRCSTAMRCSVHTSSFPVDPESVQIWRRG